MERFLFKNVTEEEPKISDLLEPDETDKLENSIETSTTTYKTPSQDFLTPEILWSQNESTVRLKINLANVEDYKFDCSIDSFMFR